MDQTVSREKDLEYDLESGGNTSERRGKQDLDCSEKRWKNLFSWTWNRLPNFDGSKKHESGVETCSSSSKSADVMDDGVPLPLLDAADKKLVQDIAEIALRKRERIKKMKATRKMKARKASSSSSYAGLSAMVITIFFFAIIIIQGIRSGRGAAVGVMASPEPSIAADEGLISVRFSKNFTHEVVQGT
ncbi:uncharacterized protein LOC114728306 [Neltuma alba]|uniref:uncharacterized protein LOC114728306 n=1 Tax=Neltuma alba TaxID=207710 RepID=UPI0010A2E290|nr:uncharacterized protein LOC114728306 [Prosopis alba]